MKEEGGISAEDVAAVLGLPDGIDPLTFNPFDVDENDAAAVAAALEVEKVSQQIMTTVTSFASAAEGAGAGAGDAFTAALGSVVDVVKTKADKIDDPNAAAADKAIDFTNAADLALIKTEATSKAAALDGIDAATMNALADDTTAAIKNVNDKIATVTDLDADATKDIFSTLQVLKDQVRDAAETQKAGGVANIAFKNRAEVDSAALNKAPQAITLSGDRLVSKDGDLVVGTVATIDSDQASGTAFTYRLAGRDADMFSFDASSGELSLKAAPNYATKPFYEITIITKDAGGKKFAETFKIDVVPEFGALGDPDPTVASDFEMIMKQNPLFMRMNSEVQLKQTPEGQLVLVELMSSDGGGNGSPSDSNSGSSSDDGPIMAFINVTERGYELLNPATNDYMGGFFTYEEDGLTYTGYEVFVDDMSVLAKYEEDLIKYFAPDSTYGSGALKYTERDIEFVSLVGAKAVDKDGHAVQEMLGFSHYDKDMNVLGSAGIDVADPSKPAYIEVVGEYDPAVSTNIISTPMSDASVGLEMQTLLQTAGEAILYGDDHDHGETAVNGGGAPGAGGAPTEIIEVQAGSMVKFKYEAAERGSVLKKAEFVFLDDNGGRLTFRDLDNDGIASFKTSSDLMNGVYTLNQVILSDFNDISNSANYFANEITAFGPPGSTPPQGTNLGLIIKNEFSYSNHNFDLGKYAIKVVGGKEARTDFTAPELISVTIDNPAITPGQQVSIKYNVNDDSPLNNVSFRFANDAGEHIILSDFDNDGVATTDVDALRMNGSYTLQEASFRDVAGNYSGYKAVGGHSGPPPPPGVPINNDPNLNLETSTGWPNKEFLSHKFDFSQFTLEMSGGIAVQTDFTHPELAALEKVVTVNQGAVGTINYTPSEVLGYASFTFKNDAGKQLHFEDRENDGIARVSAIQTSTTGTYELSQIYMRDLNKITNNSSYYEGNELHLRTSDFQKETTHDLDFSQYTVNVVEWGGISETDMPTFASAAMENAVISWREFGEINYVADGTGSSLESVEFHFTSPSGERVSFWDYDDDGVATALLSNYSLKNETFSLERVQLRDEGGQHSSVDGWQPTRFRVHSHGRKPCLGRHQCPNFCVCYAGKYSCK